MVGRISAVFLAAIALGLLGGCWVGPWAPDCSIGECGNERRVAERMADDAAFDLDDQSAVDLLDVGEEIIVTGRITEQYVEMTFEGEAGTWFDISVHSLGLPNPSFILTGARFYKRWSPRSSNGIGERVVALPDDGTYVLRVYSEAWNHDEGASPVWEGPEPWFFVLKLARISPPEPTVVELSSYTQLRFEPQDIRKNLIEFRVPENTEAIHIASAGWSGRPELVVQHGEYLSRQSILNRDISLDSDRLHVLFEYSNDGGGSTYFKVGVHPIEPAEQSREESFSLQAGEAILFAAERRQHSPPYSVTFHHQGTVFQEFRRFRLHHHPAVFAAWEGEEVDVHIRSNERDEFDHLYELDVVQPTHLGSVAPGDEPTFSGNGAPLGEPFDLLQVDIEEDALLMVASNREVHLFERTNADELLHATPGEWSDLTAAAAGSYLLLITADEEESIEDWELTLSLVAAAPRVEHRETISLEAHDVVRVRPYSSPVIQARVWMEKDGEVVAGPSWLWGNEYFRFATEEAGDFELVMLAPVQVSPSTFNPEITITAAEPVGTLAIGDSPHAPTPDSPNGLYSLILEAADPLYFSWQTQKLPGAEGNLLANVALLSLAEDMAPALPVRDDRVGRLAGIVDRGTYLLSNELFFDDLAATLTVRPLPRVLRPLLEPKKIAAGEEMELTVEVSDCGVPDHVAVAVDVAHPRTNQLQVEIEHPDQTRVVLLEKSAPQELLTGNFPDGFAPHESMTPLQATSADGTWRLRITDHREHQVPGSLRDWALLLWCS